MGNKVTTPRRFTQAQVKVFRQRANDWKIRYLLEKVDHELTKRSLASAEAELKKKRKDRAG